MKIVRLIAAALIGAGLSTLVHAQGMPGGYGDQGGYGGQGGGGYGGQGGGGGAIRDGSELAAPRSASSNDPLGYAEELRVEGKCDLAVPILRRLVESPQNFPITKYNLGLCLLDLAARDGDAQHAAAMRREAASWILDAADHAFNKAQAKAVELELDGIGVAADPVEAEKWALLYHDNGSRLALGLPDIALALRDRLEAALTDAQQAEAQARADAWVPKTRPLDR